MCRLLAIVSGMHNATHAKAYTFRRNGDDMLWEHTLQALYAGLWSEARACLDRLCREHGESAVDCLPSLSDIERSVVFRESGAHALEGDHRNAIDDRIALWNRLVHRRATMRTRS